MSPGHGSDLAAFLRRSAAQGFDWNTRNCAFWVADWIREARGFDPVPDWRERDLDGERAWLRAVLQRGGMCALAMSIAERCGLQRTEDAQRGDVGCLLIGTRQIMGIAAGGGRVAMRTMTGIHVAPVPFLMAWSVA